MKLGIITDIHEHSSLLELCLRKLRLENVDRIVLLGDVYQLGHHLDETCRLLKAYDVSGVWGNHDFGLCVNPEPDIAGRFASESISFMQSLTSHLVIEDYYFAHVEPWLNPQRIEDLWFFEGIPETAERRNRIFSAGPQRIFFSGHYHQWLLVKPDGTDSWQGNEPVCLRDGRSFVVIDALMHGSFAIYETTTGWLTPFRLTRCGGESES